MDNDQAIFQKQEHKPLRAVPFLSTLQTSIFCCWWLWNPETFKSVFNELQVLKDQTLNSEALPGCCTEWHDLLHCRSDTSDTTEFAGFFNHTEIILKLNSWERFSHISHRSWFLSSLTVFFPHSAMTCMLVYFYVCCHKQKQWKTQMYQLAVLPMMDILLLILSSFVACQSERKQPLKKKKKKTKAVILWGYYFSSFSKAMEVRVLQVSGLPCSFQCEPCRSKAGSQPRRLCAAGAVTMLKQ